MDGPFCGSPEPGLWWAAVRPLTDLYIHTEDRKGQIVHRGDPVCPSLLPMVLAGIRGGVSKDLNPTDFRPHDPFQSGALFPEKRFYYLADRGHLDLLNTS